MTTPVFEASKAWDDSEPLGPDIPPDRGDGAPDPMSVSLPCEVCGTPVYRTSPRGRAPRRCAEHKSGGGTSHHGPTKAPTGVSEAALTRINVGLTSQFLTFGRVLRSVEPFDGSVLVNNSEDIGQKCEDIARRDPKFRKACEDYLSKTGYIELSVLALAILTPIAMHHGIMPGRKLPAEFVAEVERRQIVHADEVLDAYSMRNATTGL